LTSVRRKDEARIDDGSQAFDASYISSKINNFSLQCNLTENEINFIAVLLNPANVNA